MLCASGKRFSQGLLPSLTPKCGDLEPRTRCLTLHSTPHTVLPKPSQWEAAFLAFVHSFSLAPHAELASLQDTVT